MRNSNEFSAYLSTLSRGEHAYVIERLVDGCFVPRQTVYNWKHGVVRIPELYKIKIEEIIGKKIFKRM